MITPEEVVMIKCAVCMFLGMVFGIIIMAMYKFGNTQTDEKEDTK